MKTGTHSFLVLNLNDIASHIYIVQVFELYIYSLDDIYMVLIIEIYMYGSNYIYMMHIHIWSLTYTLILV